MQAGIPHRDYEVAEEKKKPRRSRAGWSRDQFPLTYDSFCSYGRIRIMAIKTPGTKYI